MPSSLREKAALPLSKLHERGRRLLRPRQVPRSDAAPSSAKPPSRLLPLRLRLRPAPRPDAAAKPSSSVLVRPTACPHPYPAPPATLAHPPPPLCPHCAIAAPASAADAQPTTLAARSCGHALTVRRRTAAVVAANPGVFAGARGRRAGEFSCEFCAGCLRERHRGAVGRLVGAEKRGRGREVERARVGAWRVWLSGVEIEEEMAVGGGEGDGGREGGGGRRKRDSGFWSVRSLSLRSWRSKNGDGVGERVEEDGGRGRGGKKKVVFDESCKGEDVMGRHHTLFDRKSRWYKKGKYAVRKPLDTSGWAVTDEKDIRRWYSPPLGSNASSEGDGSLSTKRRRWF